MIELELLAVLARPRQDVCNLGNKFVSFKISARSYRDTERVELHGEISPISARCRKSRCEFDEIMARSQQCRQDGGNLTENENLANIMARAGRDLVNLSEISVKILHRIRQV